jgi:hypothetical protein
MVPTSDGITGLNLKQIATTFSNYNAARERRMYFLLERNF